MGDILNPDFGLMFWTVVTFLSLVFILGKFAWGPLLHAIEEREEKMRSERAAAEKARAEAQRIQVELEAKLDAIDAKAKEVLAAASKEAEALRARHSAEAKGEADRLMAKTRAQLEEDKRHLVADLREEVAALSVAAAEKLMRKSVDAGVKKAVLDEFFSDLDKQGKAN